MPRSLLKLALIEAATVFATVLAWHSNARSLIGIDDANIYMAYMRNLADGHGLVFNSGGERV